jgi:hypothetical protein
MTNEYIEVDLGKEEKLAVLKYASFFVSDPITHSDLLNKRKKWIRFNRHALLDVIGELSYHFNRYKSDYQFYFLDQLISHLENYEKRD